MSGLVLVPRRKRFPRLTLADALNRRSIEASVLQAYFHLVRIPWNESGSRSTSLARYGSYEVRLLERRSADADVPHLWVELHANNMQTSLEARGCDDIEAAALAAEGIMSRARQLEAHAGAARPGGLASRSG